MPICKPQRWKITQINRGHAKASIRAITSTMASLRRRGLCTESDNSHCVRTMARCTSHKTRTRPRKVQRDTLGALADNMRPEIHSPRLRRSNKPLKRKTGTTTQDLENAEEEKNAALQEETTTTTSTSKHHQIEIPEITTDTTTQMHPEEETTEAEERRPPETPPSDVTTTTPPKREEEALIIETIRETTTTGRNQDDKAKRTTSTLVCLRSCVLPIFARIFLLETIRRGWIQM